MHVHASDQRTGEITIMGISLSGRSFLTLLDFTPEEIRYLLDLSAEFKRMKRTGTPHRYLEGKQIVLLNGEDLGDKIRTPEMSMYASAVSTIPAVRSFLLDTQREIAKKNSVIMDGRDIGTVILPDAEVKIFMFASSEARAKRRYKELLEKGETVVYETVLAEMIERDNNDRNRDVAPAIPAEDAVHLDNSDMGIEESVDAILAIIADKGYSV